MVKKSKNMMESKDFLEITVSVDFNKVSNILLKSNYEILKSHEQVCFWDTLYIFSKNTFNNLE